ncbi:DNA polymerase I, partial [candidate division KSB1 bacterium]|nr:DNA polymerase I [candidate division KSB1 bacterium]
MPKTSSSSAAERKLFLVDGSALAYRSHFAFSRNPLTNSRGEQTGATFGFVRALLKMIDEEQPTHVAVVFDTPEPTFRHKAYKEYKATRQKMPPDLVAQLPKIRAFTEALGAHLLELPGYEADDVMGTLAQEGSAAGMAVYLFSGDKDFMQLVTEKIL